VHEEAAAGLGITTEDNKTAHAARKDLDRVPFRDEDAEESSIFIGVLREEEASTNPDDREFELAIREETHLAARKDCPFGRACRAEVGVRGTLRSFGGGPQGGRLGGRVTRGRLRGRGERHKGMGVSRGGMIGDEGVGWELIGADLKGPLVARGLSVLLLPKCNNPLVLDAHEVELGRCRDQVTRADDDVDPGVSHATEGCPLLAATEAVPPALTRGRVTVVADNGREFRFIAGHAEVTPVDPRG
jgi:hypothetical protein